MLKVFQTNLHFEFANHWSLNTTCCWTLGTPWAKLHETLKTGMWIGSCNLKNIFETCRKSTESALMIFDVVRCCLIRYRADNPRLIHSECNHCWRRLGGENVILLIFPKAWRKVSPGNALSNHRENRFLVNWWPLVGICMAMLCLYTYILAHPAVMKQGGSSLQDRYFAQHMIYINQRHRIMHGTTCTDGSFLISPSKRVCFQKVPNTMTKIGAKLKGR